MGLREQSTVVRFPELSFSVFLGAGACGIAKAISKTISFSPFGPVVLVLIIIIFEYIPLTSSFMIFRSKKYVLNICGDN